MVPSMVDDSISAISLFEDYFVYHERGCRCHVFAATRFFTAARDKLSTSPAGGDFQDIDRACRKKQNEPIHAVPQEDIDLVVAHLLHQVVSLDGNSSSGIFHLVSDFYPPKTAGPAAKWS